MPYPKKNQRRLNLQKSVFFPTIIVSILALLIIACSGGSGNGVGGMNEFDTDTSYSDEVMIVGTVPGTRIEGLCDNGAYYSTYSDNNGSNQHPFQLMLPADMGCRLVMITNEETSEEVVSPIGFLDNENTLYTRFVAPGGTRIDLGYVPLYMNRNSAANSDTNSDGVLDSPFLLDNFRSQGAMNPLKQIDSDDDGISDWEDVDRGLHRYQNRIRDPQDVDGDGIPNCYDDDFVPFCEDEDRDGLPNMVDANPGNYRYGNIILLEDLDGDGYLDDDLDRNGFHDDDLNWDGYSDPDWEQNRFRDRDQEQEQTRDRDRDCYDLQGNGPQESESN